MAHLRVKRNKPSVTNGQPVTDEPSVTTSNVTDEQTPQDGQFIQDPFTHKGTEQTETGTGKGGQDLNEDENAKRGGAGVPRDNNTPHPVGDTISITPLTYKPNWVVLAELFPEKLKNKEDAMRYIFFCLNEDKKRIVKHSPTQEAVFWQGEERRVLTEGGVKTEKKKFIPEFIRYFK